jgi:phenylpropionate dioxygenase-like ring-hydroxylating dioxygenase large terminal subunit
MAGTAQEYRPSLVDLDKGQISREIFVSEAIYRAEQERLFARAWLFVGHESQIPNPGDFFVSGMGEESVILCRDRAGEVHVFLDSCRHRGMKVCRYDEGNAPLFTCPYHGWSYGTDGKLVGLPYFREAYRSRLDRAQWGLVAVGRLANYKGAIWATWDPAAPSFAEYLGDLARYLDLTLDSWDGGDGGIEVLGGIQKWLILCDWKFPAENFCGDSYHNISHRSVDLVGIGPSGTGRRDTAPTGPPAADLVLRQRPPDRSLRTAARPADAARLRPFAGRLRLCRAMRRGAAPKARRMGAGHRQPRRSLPQHRPPSASTAHDRGVASARRAPDRGVALVFCRPGGAARGQGFPARLLHPLLRTGRHDRAGRHGELELRPCREPRRDCRRYPYSYAQGRGFEIEHYEWRGLRLPGTVMDITEAKSSEHNLRNFYRRWAAFMEAESWDELGAGRRPVA